MNSTKIIEQLQAFKSWEDKYRFIIMQGKTLPQIEQNTQDQAIEVKGCESQVRLAWQNENGRYYFQAETDARIVKGLIALVFAAINGKTQEEILSFDFDTYFEQLNLLSHLSQSRNDGINAVICIIKSILIKDDH